MTKAYYSLFFAFLFIIASLVIITGCEYDVTAPQWEKPYTSPPTPRITSIEPAEEVAPGINYITINGENFLDVPDQFGVYFDNTPAEIVSNSTTTIVVRRPNLAAEACTIKIVPKQTLVVAKYGPYKVDPVIETYGTFLNNLALSVVAVDSDENLYVIETSSKNIVKVTPDGEKTTLGTTTRPPTDAVIGPDGRLYLPANNREILVVDLQTGASSQWTRLASGRVVKCGDFDDNGYFYTGGRRSQLVVVDPDLNDVATGFYANDEIFSIRIYQNYLYLAVKIASPDAQNPELAILRHSIIGNGNVGDKELYLDLTTNENIASSTVTSIYFSENGNLYIGTDSPDPLIINVLHFNDVDYFYKNILPSNCKHFCWGTGNYIYMIANDSTQDPAWNVYRVDMGIRSAQ
jgi:hypothetical protein